ncbi:M3 family oligoendopeptidase [Halobacillus naozhouensis]|uniref:M3 family oligoendopeptidase n=1 Tax=Halobacillus naozhouensis TaxID=554880 RepID=A0ABY8IV57_9BACI|nr:M3 family oligoendopeptidase [Halobacillus naozhouensis]WFT74055.1 M3 family oligoendopeptidase [Halobacillus naozhouensis]
MENTKYAESWDLDVFFPGGSKSTQLNERLDYLEKEVSDFMKKVDTFRTPEDIGDVIDVASVIDTANKVRMELSDASSFITCLIAQDTKDKKAAVLKEKVSTIKAHFFSSMQKVQKVLAKTDDAVWQCLLNTDELKRFKFILNEWRENVDMQLSDKEESSISSLMVDGYHGWGQFYNSLVSSISVPVHIDGEKSELTVAQAINLRSHPNEEVRKEAHKALEDIWEEKEELFALILNHIAGFRLQTYKRKGIEYVIEKPLIDNRMKEETLNAMWTTVRKYKQPFADYLNQKAKMFGDQDMQSHNFWATMTNSNRYISYDDAVNFILENLSQFGTELESFAHHAFDKGWVDTEDRPNKSNVAFCAGFPHSGESRICMTYGGRITNVLTLAHELGHAFHNHAMKSVHAMNKYYPMSMAETASTFFELVVLDAAIENAKTNKEKVFLLDEKLKRSVLNFMNIHSRFLFEQNFYENRKKGFVSSTRLNELMQEAIDDAYEGSLDHVSIHSWVWTPHFYITHSPFYNFPYTFGYLFSLSIYAKAKENGRDFEENYLNILHDSGSMSTEDLVMKHLGEDIMQEGFWEKGMKLCMKDAQEFITLTSN